MQKIARILAATQHFCREIIHNPKKNIGSIISIMFCLAALVAAIGTYAINYHLPPATGLALTIVTGICYGFVGFIICISCAMITIAVLDINGALRSNFSLENWVYGTTLFYCVFTMFGVWKCAGVEAAISAAIVEITYILVGFCHDNNTARKCVSGLLRMTFGRKTTFK